MIAKVHSDLHSYFLHMTLNIIGPIFCTKNKKIDFKEKKFNKRFGECSFFLTSKDPITLSVACIKVTKLVSQNVL